MDTNKITRAMDKSREKAEVISKKHFEGEKKSKSDTITKSFGSPKSECNEENIIIIGKSCNLQKFKAFEGNLHLHECRSETALGQVSEKSNMAEDVPCEGTVLSIPSLSCTSFISALSEEDFNNKPLLKDSKNLDTEINLNDDELSVFDMSIYKQELPLQLNFNSECNYNDKSKNMEMLILEKDKKIKELKLKFQEFIASKNKVNLENKDLTHQINVLNHQLLSMYELAGQKSWDKAINPIEFIHYKNKTTELQKMVEKMEEEKKKLKQKVNTLSLQLNIREKELNSKNRELIDYKTRSTLEMCKLINKIDSLNRSMKTYSEQCSNKITEAQNSMDDELVRITFKLEDQYQKDLKVAIAKMQVNFEHLASFPLSAIEKLVENYELGSINCMSLQKEKSNKNIILNETTHNEEIYYLKSNYEKEIILLKTQIESLLKELGGKKKNIETLENLLQFSEKKPQLTLLKLSAFTNLSSFNELYKTEIIAQFKIHELEMNIFEKKVKTLTEEILYRAKNEENHLLELENARRVAQIYREKYENIVIEWGGRVQKKCEFLMKESLGQINVEDIFEQMNDLIHSLKKTEIIHEEKMNKMMENHKNEMELFQNDQLILDNTIQELIQKIGNNYVKTVKALLADHATEISLKELEMQSAEKRSLDKLTSLKEMYEKQIGDLINNVKEIEDSKYLLEEELDKIKMNCVCRNINYSKVEAETASLKLLKYEGILAIKEETELALNNRVKELEVLLKKKEDDCRKQTEDLLGKLIETNIISSAKDDLVKELESKLNESEIMCKKLHEGENKPDDFCNNIENDSEHYVDNKFSDVSTKESDTIKEFHLIKKKYDELNFKLTKAFETINDLQKENNLLKQSGYVEASKKISEKDLPLPSNQKSKIDFESGDLEKINSVVIDGFIIPTPIENKESIKELNVVNQKMNKPTSEVIDTKKGPDEEEKCFGHSQEVQTFFEEDRSAKEIKTTFDASVSCEIELNQSDYLNVTTNEYCPNYEENLIKQNEILKCKLKENQSTIYAQDEDVKKLEKELFEVINEKNEWIAVSKKLENERQILNDELKNLSNENYALRKKLENFQKKFYEKLKVCCGEKEFNLKESKIYEMKWEIEQLSDYIKSLSSKLDDMKMKNERLLMESCEVLKNRKTLLEESEEFWIKNGQAEDQPKKSKTKINFYRTHVRNNNAKMENQPSGSSWIKIHETVENIVGEVLALKTSFGESDLISETCVHRDTSKIQTESNKKSNDKTVLCDELLIQKKALETELKNLEVLLKQNDSRILSQKRFSGEKKHSDFSGNNIQELETIIAHKRTNLNEVESEEERNLLLIEIKYEEETLDLLKQFKTEIEKIQSNFFENDNLSKKLDDKMSCTLASEIKKTQNHFKKRHKALEKKYFEICSTLDKKRLSDFLDEERQRIIRCFKKILQTWEGEIQETELEIFINDIVNKFIEEIKLLRNKYKENLIEHVFEVESLQAVIAKLKENDILQNEQLNHESKNLGVSSDKSNFQCQHHTLDLLENNKILSSEEKSFNLLPNVQTKSNEEKCDFEKMQNDADLFYKDEASTTNDSSEEVFLNLKKNFPEINTQLSFLSEKSYFERNEVVTDDGKLEIIRERDSLKNVVLSLRIIVTKLIKFISQTKKDFHEDTIKDFNHEETLYKSVYLDPDNNQADFSLSHYNVSSGLELSNIIQEICNHSLLNSSEHLEFELDRCLNKIKEDAFGVLSLSNSEVYSRFKELVAKVIKEKNHILEKVQKMEEAHTELKEEVDITKNKLAMLEKNLEVVSEGYGEEVIEPKKNFFSLKSIDKMKFLAESGCTSGGISPTREATFLEEFNKDHYALQEEWRKERSDLQKQIDVADKQLHSLRNFMEEQAAERELERETFDKEINKLKENLKLKERDNALNCRTKQEIETLELQIKDLNTKIEILEFDKNCIELEFQNAVKKIWSLREVIQDLEVQLAESNEKESLLKKKIEKLDEIIKEQSKIHVTLKEEFELSKKESDLKYSDRIRNLEEERINLRRITDQVNPQDLLQMKSNLRHIENLIIKKTKDLEQWHITSANVSCSSLSEDVSIRDHLDATRCSTPDEMSNQNQNIILPLEETDRIQEKLARHTRAEEVVLKTIKDLKMQLERGRKSCEEIITERDILLERIDIYLKENSNLKARLEEHRCNAALLQKKMNADLEAQIRRLEADWEKLNELCMKKDQQLHDLKKMLENTTKALNSREAEVLNKQKEENLLISTLKTDLTNALNEKEILENDLEKTKEKLRASVKIPALIDSVIEEKNAEIDRLEKEVFRLSSEKCSLEEKSKSLKENSKISKSEKRIKFSEPECFEDCLSTISPYFPSIIRNCSDSYGEFKNSSFKIRQPQHYSKEVESLSSIGPLQLSPRGKDFNIYWKTSSPLAPEGNFVNETKKDELLEESKSHSETDIELKKTEILNLQLEIDVLKRQLMESNNELETCKIDLKTAQEESRLKDEENNKLKRESEVNLTETIESLKKKHLKEVEELQEKLGFEHNKVQKIYDEIKDLEVKKNEIEGAFYNLKDEYNEKSCREQKMMKVLVDKLKELESKNFDSKNKLADMKMKMLNADEEAKKTIETLRNELIEVQNKNESLKKSTKSSSHAQTQVENEWFDGTVGQTVDWCKLKSDTFPMKENFENIKINVNKMMEILIKIDCDKKDSAYLNAIQNLLQKILKDFNLLFAEVEYQEKSLSKSSEVEKSVNFDFQKELPSTDNFDSKLLPGPEAENLPSKENYFLSESERLQVSNNFYATFSHEANVKSIAQEVALYDEKEKKNLLEEIQNREKIIKNLEENLMAEKQRIIMEKERCKEDAKIMELLRIKLEKSFCEIKSKEKDLKKEKQLRMILEKEIKTLKKLQICDLENENIAELNRQMQSQEEKLNVLNQSLENEKFKNKELQLQLEKEKLERISEKEAQKLWESDLSLMKELKESFKNELIKTKQLLNSRNKEISILKRKISLQEIDIKALSLSDECNKQYSTVNRVDECNELTSMGLKETSSHAFYSPENFSKSILFQMNKVKNYIWRQAQESNETGEAILHLSEETEDMKDRITKLEQTVDSKLEEETLLADGELDRKLWELEKGKLLMDVETLTRENELVKRESIETCKKNEFLQLENSKLKAEVKLLEEEANFKIEMGMLRERANHLLGKYLRAESYRKALIWQKQFLTLTLNGYKFSEEEMKKKVGKMRHKKRDAKLKGNSKFRLTALAVVAIFRMKFIVRRWQKHKTSSVLDNHVQISKTNTLVETVVNRAYKEPLNPLAYQSHNLFRSKPSRGLKSPPSRDPGLINYTPTAGYL